MTKKEREEMEGRARRLEARIAAQRALFVALPPSPEAEALRAGMRERVMDLICEGRPEEADAIMEFLPEGDAELILDEMFAEQDDAANTDRS